MNANEEAVAACTSGISRRVESVRHRAVMKPLCFRWRVMPQQASSIGADAVRKAYDACSRPSKLTVKFNVAEVLEMAPNWVLARTNSAGNVKVHTTGEGGPEANQELSCSRRSTALEDRALLLLHHQPTASLTKWKLRGSSVTRRDTLKYAVAAQALIESNGDLEKSSRRLTLPAGA